MSEKFYEKFTEKKSTGNRRSSGSAFNNKARSSNAGASNNTKHSANGSASDNTARTNSGSTRSSNAGASNNTKHSANGSASGNGSRTSFRSKAPAYTPDFSCQQKLFTGNLGSDEIKILENFDEIIQGVRPLNSRQLQQLPENIKALSHQLTDQRSERRLGYMNETVQLSSYIRYYTWWNLVRLTRLFSNLSDKAFPAEDGVCLDLGTGPLTVITALWLARPELRKLKLTWYCLDVSANSMALGEDVYLSVASRAGDCEPWKIIRVKGSFGTGIKQKADFITCANMFNELDQNSQMPPEFQTKKYFDQLKNYSAAAAKYILIEPGVPKAARTISLLRDRFIREGKTILAPCPHAFECPMNGFKAYTGSQNKWCNFAFSTEDAPSKLLKLSEKAKLPKERATLSFISVVSEAANEAETAGATKAVAAKYSVTKDTAAAKDSGADNADSAENAGSYLKHTLLCRVNSDPFRLPGGRTGFYACSALGLTLVSIKVPFIKPEEDKPAPEYPLTSGDLISVKIKTPDSLPKDEKSGAVKIEL